MIAMMIMMITRVSLLPFTACAIFFAKISVMPVYAKQEAKVPSRIYAMAASAFALKPLSMVEVMSSNGRPAIRPPTMQAIIRENITFNFKRHRAHKRTTEIRTGFNRILN